MRRQDQGEYVELFNARVADVRRLAFLLLGDWHEAEDAVQAAFLKLFRHWGRVRRQDNVEAYLRRTVVNTCYDIIRRDRRRPVSLPGEVPDRPALEQTDGLEQEQILAALARIPRRQRAALVLRYYEDLSVEETARQLGCTEGTVKSQTARGIGALRVEMGRQYAAEPDDTLTAHERGAVAAAAAAADRRRTGR